MKASLLTVGMAPHRHSGRSASGMIRLTFLGLAPVIIAALYLYRGKALAILLVSVIAAVGTEVIITAIVRQPLRKLANGHAVSHTHQFAVLTGAACRERQRGEGRR